MRLIESVTNSVLQIFHSKIQFRGSVLILAPPAQLKMKVIKIASLIAIKGIIKILLWDYAFVIQELTMIQQPNYVLPPVLHTMFKVRLYVNVFL